MYVPITVTNRIQCNKCAINSIFFITTIVPDNFCIFIVFSNVYIRQCDIWIPIKNLQVNYIKPPSPTYVLKSLQGSNFLILLSKWFPFFHFTIKNCKRACFFDFIRNSDFFFIRFYKNLR